MPHRQLSSVLRHIQRIVGAPGGEELMDRQLLERFSADRDEAAFATLVRRHGPLVMGACRRLLPQAQDAEDVFQATFLVLARKAGSIRWRDSVGNWLYEVACRLARKTKSAVARRQAQERETAAMAKAASRSEVDCRELSSVLDEELQRLPGKYRTPLLLCFLEGRTRDQAARQLGWSLRTLDRRLQEGRDLLRRRLTRRGVTLSAGLLAAGLIQNSAGAAVPAALVQTTLQAALLIVSGKTAGVGTISASVAALTRSACLTMTVTRPKVAGAVLLALGLLGTGIAAVLVRQGTGSNAVEKLLAIAPPGEGRANEEPARAGPDPDPLPPGAVARLGSTRMRPGHPVGSVAFSPDGKALVSGNWGPGIHVWDTATGKELRRFATQHHGLHVAYCPDGKTLASLNSNEKMVRLWDLESGAELRQLVGHEGHISAFAVAPHGKKLASAGTDKTVRLWRVDTGEQIRQFGHSDDIRFLAYSQDGKFLAGGTESGGIMLWECGTGKLLHQLAGHQRDVSQLAWSPDDRILASGGSDGTIRLWDPGKGREIRRLGTGTREQIEKERKKVAAEKVAESGAGYLGRVNGLVFSRDGKLLYSAGGDYRCIFVWEVASGKELRRLEGPQRVFCLAGSVDGKTLAVGGTAHQIDLWNLNTDKRIHPLTGPQGRVDAVAFSSDGKVLATAGDDDYVRVWEAGSWRELQRLPRGDLPNGEPVGFLRFSADGKWLGVCAPPCCRVYVWDWAAKKEVRRFVEGRVGSSGHSLAFSPDGKMLAAPFEGVTVWDMATGNKLHNFECRFPGPGGAHSLDFSPDGRLLALGTLGTIYLCEPITGKVVRKFEELQDSVTTPSGHKFSNMISGFAFSADGKSVLSGAYDAKLRLWEAATGKQRLILEGHEIHIQSVAISPDGKCLASGSGSIWDHNDNTVRLWDAVTGKELRRFTAHQNVVVSIAFSADGSVLASGSEDGTVLIWDVSRLDSAKKVDAKKLSAADLESLWADLAGEDAAKAYQAKHKFASTPSQALPFLEKNLQPAAAVDVSRLAHLIADLDSDRFPVRQKAARKLEDLGELAESALRKELQGKPSQEMRRQIERLLEKLLDAPAGKQLRALRAVEVLEHLGTPEARDVLRMLTKGVAEARLTQEAKASLERLARRTSVKP